MALRKINGLGAQKLPFWGLLRIHQAWYKLLGAINFPLPMGLHPQKVRPWRCGSKEVPHHGDRSEVGLEVRMRLLEQAQLYLLPERTFQLQYGCQGELKRVAPPWGTLSGVCH